jgi:dolichyl-diphosphooligosaccharide--protein glycosyltransferase
MEYQVKHWPQPLKHDPLGAYPDGQSSAVAPLFDFLLATLGLMLPLHSVAAWAPPVMAGLTSVAVWALARRIFGIPAAWLAGLLAAVLPGRWLVVGKLGFADHHVLEGLTVVCLLWALAERRYRWAGFFLGAYLLTWVGGALVAALVVAWMLLEQLVAQSAGRHGDSSTYWTLGIALAMAAPFYDVLWMPYAIAVLGGGLAGLYLLQRTGWKAAVIAGLALAAALLVFPETRRLLVYFKPRSGQALVTELRPLLVRGGEFTLVPALQQFTLAGAAAVAAMIAGVPRLWRKEESAFRLIWGFAALFLFMTIAQERMAQYFAPAAAVFAAGLVAGILRGRDDSKRFPGLPRLTAFVLAGALLAGPNLLFHEQMIGEDTGIPVAWRDALRWLKDRSPEPSPQSWGVLNWWPSGYWITAVAERMPLSNPTQRGAAEAAKLFLSKEEDASSLLRHRGLRYAFVDHTLLMLPGEDAIRGTFAALVAWAGDDISSYMQVFYRPQPDGSLVQTVYFMPDYFRTLLARIGLGGAWKKPPDSSDVLAIAWTRKTRAGQPYKEIEAEVTAPPDVAAAFVEGQRKLGRTASVVTADPMRPCVPLSFPRGLRIRYPERLGFAPEVLVIEVEPAAPPVK